MSTDGPPAETGFPSGPTNTPPSDSATESPAPESTDDPLTSGQAGSSPATWPDEDGPGVAGRTSAGPGGDEAQAVGGTSLTTADTEP